MLLPITFIPAAIIAQDYKTIKPFFYNLPIEKSREQIYTAIQNDSRFISTDTDSAIFFFSYLGKYKEKGIIQPLPDSNEIELTFGYGVGPYKSSKNQSGKDLTYLKLRYYYANANTAKTAYQQVMNKIKPHFKNSFATGIDTVFSDDSIRCQLKTKGYAFKNKAAQWEIAVVFASITTILWGVFIELEKVERPLNVVKRKK